MMIRDIKYIISWLCILPLGVPILIVSIILKFLSTGCAQIFRKDLLPIKALDYIVVSYLGRDFSHPKEDNFNIGFTCMLHGKVNSEKFFYKFVKDVISIKEPALAKDDPHIRFHQNITKFFGYWYFKTFEELIYKNHVVSNTMGKQHYSSIEEEVCNWIKIRYKDDCPMWGMFFLYHEDRNETIFAFKIHHVLADGYTLMHILDLMTNKSYNYQVKDFQDSKWTKLVILKAAVYNVFQFIRKIFSVPKKCLPEVNNQDMEIISNKPFMTFTSLPLQIIKEIRMKADVNFASVMLYLINGCIRDLYVEHVNKKLLRKIPEYNIISNTLPWPKHPRSVMCNHLTAGIFKFDLSPYCSHNGRELTSPIDREFKGFHTMHLNRITHRVWELLAIFPDWIMSSRVIHNGFLDRITASYIHLTGSQQYGTVMGITCNDIRMFCLLPSKINQMVFTCLTTSDEVRMVISGNSPLFSTQEDVDCFFQKSFQRKLNELTST